MKATREFTLTPKQTYPHSEWCDGEGNGDMHCRACHEINTEPIGFSIGRAICFVILLFMFAQVIHWVNDPANNTDSSEYAPDYP